MLPKQNVMLEIDRHLISEHDIRHRHKLTVDRDSHIGDLQRPLGVMQFSLGHGIAEHTILILFILIWRCIDALGWHSSTILALWLLRSIWILWGWGWCLAGWHLPATTATKFYS